MSKKKIARIVANVLAGRKDIHVCGYNVSDKLYKDLGLPKHAKKLTLTIESTGAAIVVCEFYSPTIGSPIQSKTYKLKLPETIFEDYYLLKIGDKK